MFERIVEIFKELFDYFRFWTVLDEYEAGVMLRLGRYNRDLGPGLHWKWFGFERDLSTETTISTMDLRYQTVETSDGIPIVVSAVVKYRIREVKKYLLEVDGEDDVLSDTTLGAIREAINSHSYAENIRHTADVEKEILSNVRKEVNQYGFQIYKVVFADIAKVKTIRVMGMGG